MNRHTSPVKTVAFSLRLYPPIWFMLFALMALALAWLWPLHFPFPGVFQPLSLVLAAIGGGFALWAALLFKRHSTTAHPYEEANRLVTRGPYRISRNPMYLGLLLTLIALGIWLQSLSALLMAPLFVLVINRCNVLPEEHRLRACFGSEYEAYLRRTRRWF
jgi:protein-S-isoprenylcysteine O-methyltransferase Ste14